MNKIWTPKIILPDILGADPRLDAARVALERQLQLLSEAARECIFLPRLDELPEHVLDLLAEQYHVDFYEPLGMSVDIKRAFIRNAILWHRFKGTPAAVEQVLSRAFSIARVAEWHEYGGEPYFFRIHIDITSDDEDTDRDTLNRLRKAVRESKNARSWLEYYNFYLATEETVTVADANSFVLKPDLFDRYDYRVIAAAYDSSASYDAATVYSGVQAADFEVFSIDGVTLNHADSVSVDDVNPFRAVLDQFRDSVDAQDSYVAFPHFAHADSVDVRAELGALPATLAIGDSVDPVVDSIFAHVNLSILDSIAPYDDAQFTPVQIFRYDGQHDYGGAIDYSSSLAGDVVFVTDDEDQRRWALLQRELELAFDESCTCGAADYEWWYSSIRLGEERFLSSDPQLITVEIKCRRCGNVLAEYIVPSDDWEVRI